MSLQVDELPTRVRDILNRAGLTTHKSILEAQECDLRNHGCLTGSEINQLVSVAAKQAKPPEFVRGEELTASRWGQLSVGCSILDQLLRGGVLTRGLTELAGHSGCGKTQLCLQLAITAQLPTSVGGLSAGTAFICTEDRFPSVRLNQLLKTFPAVRQFPDIQFGNNIFIEHIADSADLIRCVSSRLPQLVTQHQVRLVVVDSVAAVFRADYLPSEAIQRARDLRAFALQLHLLANTHNMAVLCVNQVSDVKRGEKTETVPALGLAWANLVTCRLQMFRNNDTRHLKVVFAPHLPNQSCQYKITEAGVVGIE